MNGSPSAVACTSTSRPSPVMTTFMSTSAVESSVYSRSSSGSPSTIPTETAATDPASALERPKLVERAARGDVRAGDRGAARAAVGLQHVAVEPDRPLSERLEVGHARGARGRSAAGSRPSGRPACPRDASRAMRSPVDAGSSEYSAVIQPLALVAKPARNAVVDHRRAEHLRLALRPQHGAVRLLEVVELDLSGRSSSVRRPSLMRRAPARRARRARPRGSAAAGSARPSRGRPRGRRS